MLEKIKAQLREKNIPHEDAKTPYSKKRFLRWRERSKESIKPWEVTMDTYSYNEDGKIHKNGFILKDIKDSVILHKVLFKDVLSGLDR